MSLSNKIGNKLIAMLILSWIMSFALSDKIHALNVSLNKSYSATKEKVLFSQNTVAPVAISSILFYNYNFQSTSGRDVSRQLNAALMGYNQLVKCRFIWQQQCLSRVYIKFRKSDFLFPFHYFW